MPETVTAQFIRDRIANIFASSQRYYGSLEAKKKLVILKVVDKLGDTGLPPSIRALLHIHNWAYSEVGDEYHLFPKGEGHGVYQ